MNTTNIKKLTQEALLLDSSILLISTNLCGVFGGVALPSQLFDLCHFDFSESTYRRLLKSMEDALLIKKDKGTGFSLVVASKTLFRLLGTVRPVSPKISLKGVYERSKLVSMVSLNYNLFYDSSNISNFNCFTKNALFINRFNDNDLTDFGNIIKRESFFNALNKACFNKARKPANVLERCEALGVGILYCSKSKQFVLFFSVNNGKTYSKNIELLKELESFFGSLISGSKVVFYLIASNPKEDSYISRLTDLSSKYPYLKINTYYYNNKYFGGVALY